MTDKNDNPLSGKTVIFLGSSVTYGSASGGVSFADILKEEDGIISVKEAVSGTTLADFDSSSYISRMKTVDSGIKADAFICQLSTNDASQKIPLGEISDSSDENSFDTKTVAGAIEYIICHAKKTWSCPVIFYTGTKYDSERYEKMVGLLTEIQKKHGNVLTYEQTDEKGPDHDKLFVFDVKLNGKVIGTGEGRSKKEAEQAAAGAALENLKV